MPTNNTAHKLTQLTQAQTQTQGQTKDSQHNTTEYCQTLLTFVKWLRREDLLNRIVAQSGNTHLNAPELDSSLCTARRWMPCAPRCITKQALTLNLHHGDTGLAHTAAAWCWMLCPRHLSLLLFSAMPRRKLDGGMDLFHGALVPGRHLDLCVSKGELDGDAPVLYQTSARRQLHGDTPQQTVVIRPGVIHPPASCGAGQAWR